DASAGEDGAAHRADAAVPAPDRVDAAVPAPDAPREDGMVATMQVQAVSYDAWDRDEESRAIDRPATGPLRRKLDRFPFVPDDPARLAQDCYGAVSSHVPGLVRRLSAIGGGPPGGNATAPQHRPPPLPAHRPRTPGRGVPRGVLAPGRGAGAPAQCDRRGPARGNRPGARRLRLPGLHACAAGVRPGDGPAGPGPLRDP